MSALENELNPPEYHPECGHIVGGVRPPFLEDQL